VTVEITPEPTPEERAALLRALATLNGAADQGGSSAWWRAGILEAVDEEPEKEG
jgi:hypothetical protein